MEELVEELEKLGLTREQTRQVLTIMSRWTSDQYPVLGTLVENILKKNRLIEYHL